MKTKIRDKQIRDEIVLFNLYVINFLLIGYSMIEKIKEIKIYANMKISYQKRKTIKNPRKIVKKVLVFFFIIFI